MSQIIVALACTLLLASCSAVKIAYDQAPELAYWYLDGYLDFSATQSQQVKIELDRLHRWHRQTQLPAYAQTLNQLQQQLSGDINAAQACRVFSDLRGKLLTLSDQAEPAVVALAASMGPAQWQQMERKFAKGNAEFRADYLDGAPRDIRSKRIEQIENRAEQLYGKLQDQQRDVIAKRVDQTRFNAALAYAERLRRQQDTVRTLRELSQNPITATPEASRSAMRALFERSLNSPNPAYRDHVDAVTQDGCQTFAYLHNATSPDQRTFAQAKLKDYEQDLRTLNRN